MSATTLNTIANYNKGFDKVLANKDAYRLILQFAGTKSNKRKFDEFVGKKVKRQHKYSAYNMYCREHEAKKLSGSARANAWAAIKAQPKLMAKYNRLAEEENELVKYESHLDTKLRKKRYAIKAQQERNGLLQKSYKTVMQLKESEFLHWESEETYGKVAVPYETKPHLRLTKAEKALYIRVKEQEIDVNRLEDDKLRFLAWAQINQSKLDANQWANALYN